MTTIDLPLNKTYATIRDQNLTDLDDSVYLNHLNESREVIRVTGEATDYRKLLISLSDNHLDKVFTNDLFLNSTDILPVIRKNPLKYKNSIITIISGDLPNIYLNNKQFLNDNDLVELDKCLKSDSPQFENIVDYAELIEYTGSKDIEDRLKTPIYQLIGTINPCYVLHISVTEFLQQISKNKPITIRLRKTRLFVSLQYEAYDFYDLSEGIVDRSI